MRIKFFILTSALSLILHIQFTFSQTKETCESPKEEPIIEDLNSITKCNINDNSKDEISNFTSRNSKRVTIQVSSRKRVIRRKESASSASSVKALSKLEKIKKSTSLVGSLNLNNKNTAEKLPFDFVEEKPLFKDCVNTPIKEQSKCFKKEIVQHVKRNFKYPKESYEKSIQGRVLVQFVINENGNVDDIITRGPIQGEELEAEAKKIIKKLPKFSPGKMGGRTIKVKYGFPIIFKIPDREPSNIKKKNNIVLNEIINFATVQNIPLFKACENKTNEDEKLNCFNSQMSKHVQKYFAYPKEAAENNIQGRVYAYFVIDKEGNVVNIRTRGPKNGQILEFATEKLVEKLPKFIPGKHNGKNTNVKYAFPINFKLN